MQSGVAKRVDVRNWAEVATVKVKAATGLYRRSRCWCSGRVETVAQTEHAAEGGEYEVSAGWIHTDNGSVKNLSSEAGQTILKEKVTAVAEAIKLELDQRVFSEKPWKHQELVKYLTV